MKWKMERSEIPKYVMSTLCRLCAEKSSTLTPIFDNEALHLKIYKCLSIQVNQSDFLPLKICESCYSKINDSYTLYIKAVEADKRLKSLWKILLKETTVDFSESVESGENIAATNETEEQGHYLVSNIPQERTEPLADAQLENVKPNEVMVISRAVSFEVIAECVILKSSDKSSNKSQRNETLERKAVFEQKEEISDNATSEQTGKEYQCQSSSAANSCAQERVQSGKRIQLSDTHGKLLKDTKHPRTQAQSNSSNRKKRICKVCSKGFLTNFFLREHMNSHTGETPYKCGVCGKEFRERGHLRQHMWTHSTQRFVCPFCGSKFNRKGNMTEHVKQYHRNESTIKPRKKQEESAAEAADLKCPVCSIEFPTHPLLKTHLKIHPEQKRFSCSLCGKKFRHQGSLTYHRRTAHTGERPFQCGYCDRKFSLRSLQLIHERKSHTFEHPYKCAFCSRPFTNSSALRNHMSVHAKEKMFKCDECGKKFSRNSTLAVHKKLHTGDRKFCCEHCGKSYIQKHDLVRHQKVHDPRSKPFFCKYCGNSFSHKKDSAKHAMCQFDLMRKRSAETDSAEKILDSVSDLEKSGRSFFLEEEGHLILGSVEELSGEKMTDEDVILPQ